MTSPKRGIILFIVEGPSDETALAKGLEDVLGSQNVKVRVMHCDITTDKDSNSQTLRKRVGDIVKSYITRYGFKSSDIIKVVQITDTDGVYIQDQFVVEDSKIEDTIYTVDEIQTPRRDDIIKRNSRKRENLRILIQTKTILGKIPYQILYFSSSLEHVLHNTLNATNAEKKALAEKFRLEYCSGIFNFSDFFTSTDISVHSKGYLDSWNFIYKDRNSLCRWTNFALCFLK